LGKHKSGLRAFCRGPQKNPVFREKKINKF
jgi:hypothetical protein